MKIEENFTELIGVVKQTIRHKNFRNLIYSLLRKSFKINIRINTCSYTGFGLDKQEIVKPEDLCKGVFKEEYVKHSIINKEK